MALPRFRRSKPDLEPPVQVSGPEGGRWQWRDALSPLLALLAALLWLLGLHPVLPVQLGGLGLVTALSPVLLASYPVLLTAVVLELSRRRPRSRVLSCFTTLGVALVYGLQPASEQTARLTVSWLHTGFARYVADNGQALQGYDARFSWPGFFSLIAFLTKASGQPDASPLLQWAPVVFAGAAVLGMRALAAAVFGTGRAGWLATWVFLLTQWTEQDYLSPQAGSYLIMLAALALTVRYLVRPGLAQPTRPRWARRAPPANLPRERLAAHVLILVFGLALAPTHQLTPFVLAGLLLVMALTRRLWPSWLPWLVLIPALMWFSLGAKDFWQGQLHMVIGDVGQVSNSVDQGITGRFVGDAGRTAILLVRVALTGTVGALALGGWWARHRRGLHALPLVLLAAAPLAIAVLQSYGGEVFVRCYLFALPFAALLAGAGLDAALGARAAPGAQSATRRVHHRFPLVRPVVVWLVLTLLGLATVVARGGGDAYLSYTRSDVAAVADAYRLAKPGQTISGLSADATPLGFDKIGLVEQTAVEDTCPQFAQVANCVREAAPDYFVVTPSQENYGRIYYGLQPGWTSRLVADLVSSGKYHVVFDEGGSRLLARTGRG
ncbi:hypothetical protein [Amycolatopsis sp. FDAARGOS 1241]|uniref:hypothetical protein n=1 Tax=Amycolatopsis sp. FDAARGOS 1241 TaxID=2778070 RepID=UPI00194E3172|nr:hypothetical protein [Amycolatopsis sp. FDAARGOS 1241]QRP47869.1 hypothetical protein I6J71_08135 [Amycolatopsis sp. FDAARGOS 1241]